MPAFAVAGAQSVGGDGLSGTIQQGVEEDWSEKRMAGVLHHGGQTEVEDNEPARIIIQRGNDPKILLATPRESGATSLIIKFVPFQTGLPMSGNAEIPPRHHC